MGKVDVMFTIGIHASLQCEENEIARELEDARDKVGSSLDFDYHQIGGVTVEVVKMADIDPETGKILEARPFNQIEINPN